MTLNPGSNVQPAAKQRLAWIPASLFVTTVFPLRLLLGIASLPFAIATFVIEIPAACLTRVGARRLSRHLSAIASRVHAIGMKLWAQSWVLGATFGLASGAGITMVNWQGLVRRRIGWAQVQSIEVIFDPLVFKRRLRLVSGETVNVNVLDPVTFDTVAKGAGHEYDDFWTSKVELTTTLSRASEQTVAALMKALPMDRGEVKWLVIGTTLTNAGDAGMPWRPESGDARFGVDLIRYLVDQKARVAFAVSVAPEKLVCIKTWEPDSDEPNWPDGFRWGAVHYHAPLPLSGV